MSRNYIRRTLIEITSTSTEEATNILKLLNGRNVFENKGYLHAGATMKISTYSENTEARIKTVSSMRFEKQGNETVLIIPSKMNFTI